MREVEDMREALDRVEKNLNRFRWIITHPEKAYEIFEKPQSALDLCKAIDNARNSR